ncbi:MAG: FAD:protein FMN transferase [Betaproteobacteria bacterium]|nr:FAD:protein FMN transferase [Betaproteobacteria bacterium]
MPLAWLLWVSVLVLGLAGCGQPPLYTQESYVFGTRVQISIYGEKRAKAEAAAKQVLSEFDVLHHRLHAWEPSELSSLNDGFARSEVPVKIAPDLAAMLVDATADSERSGGSFNPAIGNLIRLWGFQSDTFVPHQPDPLSIAKLLAARPQMRDIVINNGEAYSTNPAVRLDLGGYAKGYALDVAAQILRSMGIHNALINIGGNILALGQHGDHPWRVGIQHPRKPQAIASLALRDGEAIGTSGDYQRYFELGGRRYCHIIDPRTGWPVQGVESVTVLISPGPHAGVRSDVDSKPLFIAGVAGWRKAAAVMGVQAAMLIDGQGHIYLTPSLRERLTFIPTQG